MPSTRMGDDLTYSIISDVSKGTVNITDVITGAFIYSPTTGESGTDTFTFSVNDGFVDSNIATITVTLTAQSNDETVYEDAEDGTTLGWEIFDNDPSGASIQNVYDTERDSNVILFESANGTANGCRFKNADGSNWQNTSQFVVQWSMNYAEDYVVYLDVQSAEGQRYLSYEPVNVDYLGTSQTVHHGLGSGSKDGQWHTFTRDLQPDLEEAQPGNTIIQVNGFYVRGSGMVDDIKLANSISVLSTFSLPGENFENSESLVEELTDDLGFREAGPIEMQDQIGPSEVP